MKKLMLMLSMLILAACSAEPAQENVSTVEQGVCSGLYCPYSLPGYPTFMYAYNYSSSIVCHYRNNSFGYNQTTLQKAPGCGTCCAVGYCPDQRIGQPTYSTNWQCSAP
jgi:hypothetical protein